jgi:hypothetical protein
MRLVLLLDDAIADLQRLQKTYQLQIELLYCVVQYIARQFGYSVTLFWTAFPGQTRTDINLPHTTPGVSGSIY